MLRAAEGTLTHLESVEELGEWEEEASKTESYFYDPSTSKKKGGRGRQGVS